MTFDTLTIVISAILVLLALVSPMMSPFFRRVRKQPHAASSQTAPPITVLLVSNGDHVALDEHLPIYLTQDYAPGYQVVVVTEKADIESENVLKRYLNDYNQKLYHTFVPESARYMSKNKLAITLGVKAAQHEWIVLTDPRCKPINNHWLEAMSHHMGSDNNMILGYANYSDDAEPFHRFEQLHTALYLLHEAQEGRAYRTNCQHLAFRKSDFMNRSGFLEYLKYSIGEYDFLVNKYGLSSPMEIATDEDTWLIENPIPKKSWQNKQVYFYEVGKHLEGGAMSRFLQGIDQIFLHLVNLLIFGVSVFAGFTSRWLLLGACVLALILTIAFRTFNAKKATRSFGVKIPGWKLYYYECIILWQHLLTHLRYEYADKNDFISHKV